MSHQNKNVKHKRHLVSWQHKTTSKKRGCEYLHFILGEGRELIEKSSSPKGVKLTGVHNYQEMRG